MTTKKTMKNNAGAIAAVGATVAALAAGTYFFFGPNGKKHRKSMKGWMFRMKAEIIEKLEMAKDMTQPVYNEIVDAVANTHITEGRIGKTDVLALADDLKRQWRTISKLIPGQSKPKARTVKARKPAARKSKA